MPSPFGMGAKPRVSSPADIQLGTVVPVQIPDVYKPDYSSIPVKFQGTYGTCGGHAGSAMESILEGIDLSPKYLWKQLAAVDSSANALGVSMDVIFNSLKQTGDCHENLCLNTLDSTIQEYSDASTITEAMTDDAYQYGIANQAYTNNPSFAQMKQAIYKYKAIIALVRCGDGWWTAKDGLGSWLEADVLPLRLGTFVDGHFIVLWGYDENYIYFRNSWGTTWGKVGDGYFDQTYVPNILEIGTAIDAPSVKQQIITLYQKLVGVLTQLLAALKTKKNVN